MIAVTKPCQTLSPAQPGLDHPYEPVMRWLSQASYEAAAAGGQPPHRTLQNWVAEWKRGRRARYYPPSMNYFSFE